MAFQPRHFGFYFTDDHIEQARKRRDTEPFKESWTLLSQQEQADTLASIQWNGLRYQFEANIGAGKHAVDLLQQGRFDSGEGVNTLEVIATAVTLAQCFEMVRDHSAFTRAIQSDWLNAFAAHVHQLNQPPYELMHFERLWLNLLNLVSGIVLEDEAVFTNAVEAYQEVIHNDIHPEGYIAKAVDPQDGHGLYRMLLSAQAVILTAEAAGHAGVNLWGYEYRGVSAMTPTPYLLYYYYYPDKWRWDNPPDKEQAQALYKQHSGFWEMAQRQTPSRDRKLLLRELRPVYDLWGGGLTSLTHGGEVETKRRGLFG